METHKLTETEQKGKLIDIINSFILKDDMTLIQLGGETFDKIKNVFKASPPTQAVEECVHCDYCKEKANQHIPLSKESDNKFEEWLENKRAACNTGQFIHIYDVIIDNYRRLSANEGEDGK